jgi:hypothetical protein
MGIQLSEVTPLGGLSRETTQNVANALWEEAERNMQLDENARAIGGGVYLDKEAVDRVLERYKPFGAGEQNNIQHLKAAGWLEDIGGGRYSPTDLVGQIGVAPKEPRMTFAEACDQIKGLRSRLAAAPNEINGIRVNHVFLFGSGVRDNNPRNTIGDLDLAVDFSFDARYDGMTELQRREHAKTAWGSIIDNGGDTRLGFRPLKPIAHEVVTNNERPDRQFGIMRLWSSERPGSSSLNEAEIAAIEAREARTVATEQRARAIAEIRGRTGGRLGGVLGLLIPPAVGAAIGVGAFLGSFDFAHAKEEGSAAAGDTGYLLGGSQPGFPRSSLYKAMGYVADKAGELVQGKVEPVKLSDNQQQRPSPPIAKP